MTEAREGTQRIDGRVARRQRNIDAVLDVVIEMFAEDAMFPTIEQAAARSGLSLRSLYRYFADAGELLEAAIKRTTLAGREMSRLHAIGEGPLDRRIDDFTSMRMRVHDAIGPVMRGALANATRHSRVRGQLAQDRDDMREQFEIQFEPELTSRKGLARTATASAGDLMTQLESIDFLRRHRQLSVAETHATITSALQALLS